VGCGGRYTVLDLFDGICRALNIERKPVLRASREGDIRDSQADITKAKELLGYEPEFDFYKGLELTVDYFKSK
jgi:UDP-N-acetylglucosamine 4-epimerase